MAEKYSTQMLFGLNSNQMLTFSEDQHGVLVDALKHFFLEGETELIALELQDPAQGGVAAEEDCHLAHLLLPDLGEDFVPVGTTSVGPRLEASDQISLFLEQSGVNNNK